MIGKIISGGQTGADRAALDVAIRHGMQHGGWCPKGRKAEDGPLGEQYQLIETPSASYIQRTEWNVRDSDGTVVFTLAPNATGGSRRTVELATRCGKPCLHLARSSPGHDGPALLLQRFVEQHGIRTLNVAGSRESKEPGIYLWVTDVIEDAFFRNQNRPGVLGEHGEG
jgi:hypothetical protein